MSLVTQKLKLKNVLFSRAATAIQSQQKKHVKKVVRKLFVTLITQVAANA
jgi:hypothetical protein